MLGVFVLLTLFLGAAFLELGPKLGFSERIRVRGELSLLDGSKLYLVQEPNGSILEPYTIQLLRVYPSSAGELTSVGYEESYWWSAALAPRPGGTNIALRAFGSTVCVYDVTTGSVTWLDGSYPVRRSQPAAQNDVVQILSSRRPVRRRAKPKRCQSMRMKSSSVDGLEQSCVKGFN